MRDDFKQIQILSDCGYERIWCSTNVEIFYQGDFFGNWGLNNKEYMNELFWWCEDLYSIQHIIDDRYKDDSFINIIAVDHITNEVLIYLDPIGTKSLYINDDNLISPSIELLRNNRSKLDYQYLGLIRKFGYNQNELTPYVNIKRLLPWFMYKWYIWKLWSEITAIRLFPTVNTEFMLPLYLQESVENRLKTIEDKTVWILLSGWLDSSLITAIVIRENENLDKPKKLRFFTTENEEDYEYAQKVAKHLGIKLELISGDEVELTEEEMYYVNETPVDLGSVIPNMKLFKKISSMWIKTVITGDGPDELFRWYKRNAEDFDYHMHDIHNELIFYHFPKLEKASRYYWIHLITPYITPQIWNMVQAFDVKIYKGNVKDIARWLIPDEVIDRVKQPLKNKELRQDIIAYQHKFLANFISYAQKTWESTPTTKKSSLR